MTTKKKMIMSRAKIAALLVTIGLLVAAFTASEASAAGFGIVPGSFDLSVVTKDGSTASQAGSHPFAVVTKFKLHTVPDPHNPEGASIPAGSPLRNADVAIPPGLIGNPTAVPTCSTTEFYRPISASHCSDDTQIGIAHAFVNFFSSSDLNVPSPIYNLTPSAGQPAAFGFWVVSVPVILVPKLRSDGDYGLTIVSRNIDETMPVNGVETALWGVPASEEHDSERGDLFWGVCGTATATPPCFSHAPVKPFLTLPDDCERGPSLTTINVESWLGEADHAESLSHDELGEPLGTTGCGKVPFAPSVVSQPTAGSAESSSGLKFEMTVPTDGIENSSGIAQSELKKAVVELPPGISVNPSAGEGQQGCSPAQYAKEQLDTAPGEGCPNASKIGTVRIDTPLLAEPLEGSLFLAQTNDPTTSQPGAENPFDSLLALYIVARNPERGILIKAAGKVEPNAQTGQLVTTFDNLPQQPFSRFTLNFREGTRAPLVTPPACGTYVTKAHLTPWSAPGEATTVESPFRITTGVNGGPCPSSGTPPFRPGLNAGTISNAAGSFSAFNLRLSRNDGEQEFTHFSIKLPPGLVGKLAGIPFCPNAAIEAARTRTATAELASPSCPAASEIGRTLVGAGVGTVLTYVPGKVYLAGPYHGSNLSIAAITAAKVGPFDVGTVVVRQALKIDPNTAEVFVDSVGSDPIPHIIDGIPVHARDIRVYVDRQGFVLNPTSCKPTSTASTVLGSGLDFVSEADDQPVTVTSPFQAASCASLGFKPKLKLRLLGKTRRAGLPRLVATVTPRAGDANIGRTVVTLPDSELLEQGHIGTSCTRVQFNSGAGNGAGCPAKAIYGRARAITPILDEPLEGNVYLRSNGGERKLPDLVAALHSKDVDINLVGFISSVRTKGAERAAIRTTFASVPDAPVSKFTLEMAGGKKGLLVNSVNLCKGTHRATALFTGQNGKQYEMAPKVIAQCGGKKGKKGKGAKGGKSAKGKGK
jgi:hypothetical protein